MMDPTQNPEYLKIGEAASLLGVARRTVYRWVWSGELPATRVGGLYFIRRSDLQAVLERGRGAKPAGHTGELSALKCGACYRIILNDSQVGEACAQEGCAEMICAQCYADGVRHCASHSPSREQRIQEARQRLERGELSVLVEGPAARQRELNYLARIQQRVARYTTLLHPLSAETITIPAWDALLEQGDERAEVMRLLGRVMLDAQATAQYPLNAWLRYNLPAAHKDLARVAVEVRSVNRLPVLLRDGFDTRPMQLEDLNAWQQRLSEECGPSLFKILLLAANTGWSDEVRASIQGGPKNYPLIQRYALLFLFDLENGELIFNSSDDRSRRYAELLRPQTLAEEAQEARAQVEKTLLIYETLTLNDAVKILSYPEPVLRLAFENLAAAGAYGLVEVGDLGLAIVKKVH